MRKTKRKHPKAIIAAKLETTKGISSHMGEMKVYNVDLTGTGSSNVSIPAWGAESASSVTGTFEMSGNGYSMSGRIKAASRERLADTLARLAKTFAQ